MVTVSASNFKEIENARKQGEKAYKQVGKGLGQPPPSGLVPINDWGLYATPDEPASPFDCVRWPKSLYCGGNPLNKKLVDLELTSTVQINPCGVTRSITVNPVLIHVNLPPVSIAHIPPNCREEYEKQSSKNPPPPPPGERDNYEPTPQYRPYGFDLDSKVFVVTVDHYYTETHEYHAGQKAWGLAIGNSYGTITEIKYPTGDLVNWYNSSGKPTSQIEALATIKGIDFGSSYLDTVWCNAYGILPKPYTNSTQFNLVNSIPPDQPTAEEIQGFGKADYKIAYHYNTGLPRVRINAAYIGRFGDIFPNEQISPIQDSRFQTSTYKNRIIHERFVVYCKKISGDASDRLPPPIPPPPKHCCEDAMGCCNPGYGNKEQQDNSQIIQLLRRIDRKLGDFPLQVTVFDANEEKRGAQQKVEKPQSVSQGIKLAIERNEKLAKIMGIDLLPITVPKTVIEKKGEGIFSQIFSFLDFNKNEEINSVLEMQSWMFQQLSGILGHWMMEIPVEDNDPLTAGNQGKDGKDIKKPENVILPNMALTMREQVAMQIQTLKALGMLVDMQIKSLIDLAGTKVLSAECAARLEDLQLYFDYETEEVIEDLGLQITFPDLNGKREDVENLANFLKEGKTKVTYDKWTVKKSQSLEEKMIQLLEMSSAIRALYFHNGA